MSGRLGWPQDGESMDSASLRLAFLVRVRAATRGLEVGFRACLVGVAFGVGFLVVG